MRLRGGPSTWRDRLTSAPRALVLPHFDFMNILVTGGSGFLGSAIVNRLREEGHTVATFDARDGCDIRDGIDCRIAAKGRDVVVHLAGVLGTDELFDAVHDAIDVNVTGTANVLDACVDAGAGYVGITMPAVFASVYTATKVAAQRLALAYHHSKGLPVCHVRAFNAYGAGQAHGPGHPRKIIPAFSCEAWSRRPLGIWGDGTQGVDLVDADDIAAVFAGAIHVVNGATIDAGTGHAMSVLDAAEIVLDVTGSRSGLRHLPMRRGEVPTAIVAKGEGWDLITPNRIPKWRPDRLAETIRSYRNHPLATVAS